MLLAVAYAHLGRKADALREGVRAVEILPVSRDANDGPDLQLDLAYVETLVGRVGRGGEAARVPPDHSIRHLRSLASSGSHVGFAARQPGVPAAARHGQVMQ